MRNWCQNPTSADGEIHESGLLASQLSAPRLTGIPSVNWGGKVAGGLLGFIVSGGNPIFAALGAFVGHQFDRGLDLGAIRAAAGGAGRYTHAERQEIFFETTFLVMGHLAKADGRVSEEEIRVARQVMHQMRLGPEEVRRAIELFTAGKQADADIDGQVRKFRQACWSQPQLVRTFLEVQFEIVLAKGAFAQAERTSLWRVADVLGVGRVELAQLEAVLRAQRSFGHAGSGRHSGVDIGEAYKALGVSADASDKEIKTAYRRLMNQHHPDKLVARGLPDSMMEVAKERTREIRAAYEVVKERRGIK